MSAVGGEGVAIEHACEAVNWSGCDPSLPISSSNCGCRLLISLLKSADRMSHEGGVDDWMEIPGIPFIKIRSCCYATGHLASCCVWPADHARDRGISSCG